jgi:hypothetical protein
MHVGIVSGCSSQSNLTLFHARGAKKDTIVASEKSALPNRVVSPLKVALSNEVVSPLKGRPVEPGGFAAEGRALANRVVSPLKVAPPNQVVWPLKVAPPNGGHSPPHQRSSWCPISCLTARVPNPRCRWSVRQCDL